MKIEIPRRLSKVLMTTMKLCGYQYLMISYKVRKGKHVYRDEIRRRKAEKFRMRAQILGEGPYPVPPELRFAALESGER